jgi:transposase InsO family protein
VIHDRDTIFSKQLDMEVTGLGVRVLRTPVRSPRANAVCERLGGSLRRECLDYLIPINERHLKMIVKEWAIPYGQNNRTR